MQYEADHAINRVQHLIGYDILRIYVSDKLNLERPFFSTVVMDKPIQGPLFA
jgi:hypothetical protein